MTFFRASNLSRPRKSFGTLSFVLASSLKILITFRLCRCPISLSLISCAGVTFTAPVPNSMSTYSSANIGISLSAIGSKTFLPITSLYLSSFGLTATPVSPSIVSGRVVATTKYLSVPTTGYLRYHSLPLTFL